MRPTIWVTSRVGDVLQNMRLGGKGPIHRVPPCWAITSRGMVAMVQQTNFEGRKQLFAPA